MQSSSTVVKKHANVLLRKFISVVVDVVMLESKVICTDVLACRQNKCFLVGAFFAKVGSVLPTTTAGTQPVDCETK